MVSGRQMAELLGLAQRSGARIVFTGDTRQIQSVEAGDALRVLETESRLKSVTLARGATADGSRLPERPSKNCGGIRKVASNDWKRSARFERSAGTIARRLLPKRGVERQRTHAVLSWSSAQLTTRSPE